jgi:ribose transport system substrate-binding protein
MLALGVAMIGGGCGGPASGSRSGAGRVLRGFDASPPLVDALRAGRIQGLVVQNPYRMGELGVRTLVDRLEEKAGEPKISTGERMVTPENMTDPEIERLLNPPKVEHGLDAGLQGAKSKKWRVMIIPKGTTHEFWKTIHAGARRRRTTWGPSRSSGRGR